MICVASSEVANEVEIVGVVEVKLLKQMVNHHPPIQWPQLEGYTPFSDTPKLFFNFLLKQVVGA